jgi:small subunit ribosomal protein S17e|uniref:Small ribosomal subunit protein eS17 n=1 Tax=Ignisphaera aggregans TaxID=334771 RepID=A0A7J2U3C7_9CREN
MGKVRISLVKRTARRLLQLYSNEFTENFQHNKEKVKNYVKTQSKKLRNQIAGYITHLVKIEEKRKESSQQISA